MYYPDAPNPDLVSRIPLTARTILDVGCSGGATGHVYKSRNPHSTYYGIEREAEAAALAAMRLDHVSHSNVETDPWPFGAVTFDCIIFGDTLEHLADPWAVLRQMAQRLSAHGVVLLCLPNLEHWSFAARLLTGGWSYQRIGLFDATHLRWFTRDTTLQAVQQARLVPVDVSGRVFDAAECARFVEAMAPSLRSLGVDPDEYHRRAVSLQYVWRARLIDTQRLNIVSTALAPVGGVSQVRVHDPMEALATQPELFSFVMADAQIPPLDPASPKIFIFHRPLLVGEEGLLPIRQLIEMNFLVVCEFDDHPDFIPVLQQPDVQNFRGVHAIQTTTQALSDVLARENPHVKIFPNAVRQIEEPRNFRDPERLTLFFGSLNRESEWPDYLPVLNRAARLAGGKLHFEIVNDEGLFQGIESEHKSFTPLCDYPTYQALLAKSEFCFMPLSDTPFNRSKSDLKFIEASSCRVVSLASPTVYEPFIEDGVNGVIFTGPEDLFRRLMALLACPDRARDIADTARRYVVEHRMLSMQVSDRGAWYRDLWRRRHDLDAALRARVPELDDSRALP